MTTPVLILLLSLAAEPNQAAPQAPPAVADALKEIEEKLDRIEAQLGRVNPKETRLGLDEAREWIDELALPPEDSTRAALEKRWQKIASKAKAPPPSPKPEESPSARKAKDAEKLEELLKVEVDLKNVSFKRDVAPIIADNCLGCHNQNRKAGEFDTTSYADFVAQVTPGKPEDSHLLNLVTGKEEPRMPRGNAGFSPELVAIWTAWIAQGAKFDGSDKKAPITSYLVDADAKRRERIAKLSPAERADLHQLAADKRIDLIRPQGDVAEFETERLFVKTTLPARDAEYVAVLAEAILDELAPRYLKDRAVNPWPGKLALFVFAKRYDYIAFARQVDNYEPEEEEFGHIRQRPELSYIALTTEVPKASLDQLVAQQVIATLLRATGAGKMPDWAVHGSARAESVHWDPAGAPTVKQELATAAAIMQRPGWSASLFDGKLPWIEAAPLATSLLTYFTNLNRRATTALQLELAQGVDAKTAVANIFRTDPEGLKEQWYPWVIRKFGSSK